MEGGQGIRSVRRCVTTAATSNCHFGIAHAAHMRARTHSPLVHAAQILILAPPQRCEMFDVCAHVRFLAFMHACVGGCGDSCYAGGDYIIQAKLDNAASLQAMLPTGAV